MYLLTITLKTKQTKSIGIDSIRNVSKKYIDTKQSNKKNNQNSKDKRQDY